MTDAARYAFTYAMHLALARSHVAGDVLTGAIMDEGAAIVAGDPVASIQAAQERVDGRRELDAWQAEAHRFAALAGWVGSPDPDLMEEAVAAVGGFVDVPCPSRYA